MNNVIVPWLKNEVIERYGETWHTILALDPSKKRQLEQLKPTNKPVPLLSKSKLKGDWIVNPFTGHLIEKYEKTWWTIILIAKDKGAMIEKLEAQPLIEYQTPILSRVGKTKNIPVSRAGVILYTIKDNVIYFGLGVDKRYHELSDFGGGVKLNQNSLTEALRELCEESVGLYCHIKLTDITNAPMMYDKHNLILFLYVNEDPLTITEKFRVLKQGKQKLEIDDIDWMDEDDFRCAIKNNSKLIYITLRNFLNKNDQFYTQL